MTTVHVRADCYMTGTSGVIANGNQFNEMFANMVQFLSGPLCSAMGISLVASNYGRSGTGLGFWDLGTGNGNAGAGAWAVFRWNSSSFGAFDAMFMIASGTNVAVNSVAPMNVQGQTLPFNVGNAHGLFGCSIAAQPSGSLTDPWNGTGTFASGVIGNPVWAADANSRLCVFPRENSPGGNISTAGSFATSRNYMIQLDGNVGGATADYVPIKMNIIVTPESLTVVVDPLKNGANADSWRFMHFGPWISRSGIISSDVPYAMVAGNQSSLSTNAPPVLYTSLYGSTAGGQTSVEGGVGHPYSVSGSRIFGVSTINNQFLANTYWNNLLSSSGQPGAFDIQPAYVVVSDGADVAILGYFALLQIGYGMFNNACNFASSSVAFSNNTANSLKWIVPWTGSFPGTLVSASRGRDV